MPKIETDKVRELHSISLTLRDILKELKRFNRNYELVKVLMENSDEITTIVEPCYDANDEEH